MKANLNLKAKLVGKLTPGELFAYDVDGSAALGIFLAKNPYGYDAVALTHAPRTPKVLPTPFAQLSHDATVLGYETTTLSVERRIKFIGSVQPSPGAIALNAGIISFTTAGCFLRCLHGAMHFDMNVETGEIDQPSTHLPRFWSPAWKLMGVEDEIVFEWPN
jgi:hypothetical protein